MDKVILPDKATTETVPFTINFGDRLQYGETINGSSVSIVVMSGEDANPSAMLVSAATTTGTTITQTVGGGIAGVVYMIVFLVTGTNSHNYVKEGWLVVTAPGTF